MWPVESEAQTTCSRAWCSTALMGILCSTTGLVTTLYSTHTGAQPCTGPEGCVRAHWEHCLHCKSPRTSMWRDLTSISK